MDLGHSLPNMAKPWLQGPLALSKESCRFELPMDIGRLKDMRILHYLSNYCVVCSRRQQLYRQSFTRADKDRDGFLTLPELKETLISSIYVQPEAAVSIDEVINLIKIDENTTPEGGKNAKDLKVNLNSFKGIGAFLERMICWHMEKQHLSEGVKWSQNDKRSTLEQTDFDGLKWKLKGYEINSNLVMLFKYL